MRPLIPHMANDYKTQHAEEKIQNSNKNSVPAN